MAPGLDGEGRLVIRTFRDGDRVMSGCDEVGDWAGDIAEADLPDGFTVEFVRAYGLVDEP